MNFADITAASNQAISGINSLIETYTNWKSSKISEESKMAFLLMECQRNLALLEVVKQGENTDQVSEHLCRVAKLLDISVLSNCFVDALNGDNSIIKKINNLDIVVENENENGKTVNKEPMAVACFIYQRTTIAKSIADLGLDFQSQHGIRFKTRLKNLENNIRIFSAALASSKSQNGIWSF